MYDFQKTTNVYSTACLGLSRGFVIFTYRATSDRGTYLICGA